MVQAADLWTRGGAYVEIELVSSRAGLARIFYDCGRGFGEAASGAAPIAAGVQTRRFPLPRAGIVALRFDPLEGEGEILVKRFDLRRPPDRIEPVDLARITEAHQIGAMELHGGTLRIKTEPGANDPYIIVPLAVPVGGCDYISRCMNILGSGAHIYLLVMLLSMAFLDAVPQAAAPGRKEEIGRLGLLAAGLSLLVMTSLALQVAW
jgi:hypothetical protein